MFTKRPQRGGRWIVVALTVAAWCLVPSVAAKDDSDNAQWSMTLVGFFPGEAKKGGGGAKRLNCYLVRREGKWVAALATATNQGRPIWNTAMMLVDPTTSSSRPAASVTRVRPAGSRSCWC